MLAYYISLLPHAGGDVVKEIVYRQGIGTA